MKTLILLAFIFLPLSFFGQQTKMIKDKKNQETYYVLKSDKSIRHGSYKKFGCGDQVVMEGYYKNGLKDSVWNEYLSYGNYTEGKRVGIWEFYFNGEIDQKYDYTNDELLFYKDDSTRNIEYNIIIGYDTLKSKLDRPPLYIGGSASLIQELLMGNEFEYPKEARKNRVSGVVITTLTIDTNGVASNHRVIKGIGSGCDEVALNNVKELPDNWLPAILDGQKVTVEMDFPTTFELIDKKKK